jgi:predicted GNAT family acetyltransferase
LDALTMQYKGVSERTRLALAAQADRAVLACDEVVEQVRTLRLGLTLLDEKARSVLAILTDPLLDPACWQQPAATSALKRALQLLVHATILREKAPGE